MLRLKSPVDNGARHAICRREREGGDGRLRATKVRPGMRLHSEREKRCKNINVLDIFRTDIVGFNQGYGGVDDPADISASGIYLEAVCSGVPIPANFAEKLHSWELR